jgi:hypothetical protein
MAHFRAGFEHSFFGVLSETIKETYETHPVKWKLNTTHKTTK